MHVSHRKRLLMARGTQGYYMVRGFAVQSCIGSSDLRRDLELAQAASLSGRSDLETMRKVLDRGLWDDLLLDPQT